MKEDGKIYISVPIGIGLALILKEINRKRFGFGYQYKFFEFIGATFLEIPGYREEPDSDYMLHKEFDFRQLIQFIKFHGWKVKIFFGGGGGGMSHYQYQHGMEIHKCF